MLGLRNASFTTVSHELIITDCSLAGLKRKLDRHYRDKRDDTGWTKKQGYLDFF